MREITAELFEKAIENGAIKNIKPFKKIAKSPYVVFDVLGTTCYTLHEALQVALQVNINQNEQINLSEKALSNAWHSPEDNYWNGY